MVTIVLLVSRRDYLDKVLTGLELMHCDASRTNILCIVDGDDELFLTTRNLVNGMKFNERLVVRSDNKETPSRLDVQKRRKHIAALHNQAGHLIGDDVDWIFSVEDDTTFGRKALDRLLSVVVNYPSIGFVEGVELGRWGVPYVGAWRADDIYSTTTIKSVEKGKGVEKIDAGGLYCALIRADLYKNHQFNSDNGLGPDVNFGMELRRTGYDNYIHWDVPCKHYNNVMGKEVVITPTDDTKVVTLTKKSDTKWITTY